MNPAKYGDGQLKNKADVSRLLKCSLSKVEKMMKAGEITYQKIGGMIRFRDSDLEPFFAGTTYSQRAGKPIPAAEASIEFTTVYDSQRDGPRGAS